VEQCWNRVKTGLEQGCNNVGTGLEQGWKRVGKGLEQGWNRVGKVLVQATDYVCRLMCGRAVQVQATDNVCRLRIICAGAYECVQADMCRRGAGSGHGYVQVQATDMCKCRRV
jgi:hypothetical protein